MRTGVVARGAALLIAVLLAVGACGDDQAQERNPGNSTTTSPTSTADTAPASTAPDDGAAPTAQETAPTAPQSDPPTSAPARSSPPATTDGPTPRSAAPPEGPVGSYGPWYLRADGAATLVVEVRSQAGAEPTAATVESIRSVLADVSDKQVTTTGGSVPGGARRWTPADIRAEADRVGPAQQPAAGVVTLLFLHGQLDGADQTIGVAVRSDVAAIFSDKVDEASGPLVGSARVEQAVTTHEVGHLLGLVDLVLDTGRADPQHPGHSPNRGSVMYYAVESTLVADLLAGGPPTAFDDADRADLRTIAGR